MSKAASATLSFTGVGNIFFHNCRKGARGEKNNKYDSWLLLMGTTDHIIWQGKTLFMTPTMREDEDAQMPGGETRQCSDHCAYTTNTKREAHAQRLLNAIQAQIKLFAAWKPNPPLKLRYAPPVTVMPFPKRTFITSSAACQISCVNTGQDGSVLLWEGIRMM